MKMKTTIQTSLLAILMLGYAHISTAQTAAVGTDFFGSVTTQSQQDLSKLPKMDRDIVILQNVLNDLFKGSREGLFYSSNAAKGMHIPGKGLIFNINFGTSVEVLFVDLDVKLDGDKEVAKDEKEVLKEKEDEIKSLSQDFLVNYGSILSELKDNEQVILNVNYSTGKGNSIKSTPNGTVSYFTTGGKSNSKRMVSSILAKDLKDFLGGKLSIDATKAKITSKTSNDGDNEANDTKIMAGILDDIFQSTFDGTFRKSGRTSWTYFEGFGLMYDMSFSSDLNRLALAYYDSEGKRIDPSKNGKENEEKLKKAEENFDKLIDLAKESLVTYGRTLRSVKSDEVIILNLNFNSGFRETSIPGAVRIQVNKSQIEAFSKGSISLDQLKKDIEITKLTSSASIDDHGLAHFPAVHGEGVLDVAPRIVTGTIKTVSFPKNKN
jgi:hypothetical protein